MEHTECTAFEAAAMWDLHRSKPAGYTGLILVVDLDRADAAICRCESGRQPRQQWCRRNGISQDYFLTVVQEHFAGCTNAANLAKMLYGGFSHPHWVQVQKDYLRSGKTTNPSMPPVVVNGTLVNLTCADLDAIYSRHWADATRKVLKEAKEQLAGEPARILPVGQLARVFLAEYLIRETFLEDPFEDDPRLRLWAPNEDPAAAVSMGMVLCRSADSNPQLLQHTLMVQTQRRQGNQLRPEMLVLAERGTSYEQLKQVSYSDPIYVGVDKSLGLLYGPHPYNIPLDQGFGTVVEVGLGVDQQKTMLFVREGSNVKKIPLKLV